MSKVCWEDSVPPADPQRKKGGDARGILLLGTVVNGWHDLKQGGRATRTVQGRYSAAPKF